MLEERGFVTRVNGDLAEIEVQRRTACGTCSAKSGCGTSVLAGVLGRKSLRIWVRNSAGAAPGDAVVLGMQDENLIGLSVSTYVIPLLLLLGGGIVGASMSTTFANGTEWPAIAGAAAGLGIGLLRLRGAMRSSGILPQDQVQMLRKEPNSWPVVTNF